MSNKLNFQTLPTVASSEGYVVVSKDDLRTPAKMLLRNLEKPYKTYIAYMFQTGTNDPEVTVYENTLGDIVWTRNGAGDYMGTLVGAFPTSTEGLWLQGANQNSQQTVILYENDNDSVGVFTDSGTDGNIAFNIEIRVY